MRVGNRIELCFKAIPVNANLAVCVVLMVSVEHCLNSQRLSASFLSPPTLDFLQAADLPFLELGCRARILLTGLFFGLFFFVFFTGVDSVVKSSECALLNSHHSSWALTAGFLSQPNDLTFLCS